MTVSSTTSKVSYSGNGSTVAFTVTFYFLASSDIKVLVRSANGTEVVKTLGTDYTVTGAGDPAGGTVTFGTAPASGQTVVLARSVPLTQVTDYTPNDPFPAETHERALDKLTQVTQQINEAVDRSIKLSLSNTMTSTEFTVDAAERANKVFGFDAAGELVVSQELGTYRGNWSSGTAYKQRDIIKDTSNANIYICITAHTASGSQPISSNTDVAKWALIVDAASATAAQVAAEAAQAAAEAAQAAAETAEANAETAETNAETAETNAETAESNAEAAQAAAEAARDLTLAAYDAFDDRYLGSKSSNPTVDNDGNTLLDGALYWNTTDNEFRVYDLGTTTWKKTVPSSAEQANINTVSGIAANVTTVAGISANVTTVAGISANVTTVATNNTNVSTVATNIANVNTVATNVASVNTVAGIAADVTSVAGNATDISAVADIDADVSTVAGIAADVSLVASDSVDIAAVAADIAKVIEVANDLQEATSEIDTVATNIADVNTVGTNIADVSTVAGISTDVTTVADNLTDIYNYADTYQGAKATAPSTRNDSSALQAGDLYFNTTDDQMKVYDGAAWGSVGSTVNGTSERFRYIATSGQTTFTGADSNGNTLAYDAGFIDVYLNGVRLDQSDYTATSGDTLVLASGATTSDELNIVTYGNFELADVYTKTASDARYEPIDSAYTKAESDAKYVELAGDTMTGKLDINAGGASSSSLRFNNNDNATISSQYSLVQQIDNTNAIGGRFFEWRKGGQGYSDGTLLMYLNSSGFLTMPYLPAFNAVPSGSNQSSGVLQAGSIVLNNGSHYNGSTYRFTAPVAGRYFFSFHFINNDSGQAGVAYIRKNGGQVNQFYTGATASGECMFAGSGILELAVNDYVDIEAYSGSYNNGYGSFTGHLIG